MLTLIPDVNDNIESVKELFGNTENLDGLYELEHYERLAIKYIKLHSGKFSSRFLKDDDIISYVTYKLIVGHCMWNKKWKHSIILEKFLWYCGRYSILFLMKLYSKNKMSKTVEYNDDLYGHHYDTDFIIYDDLLTLINKIPTLAKKQKQYLNCLCSGMSHAEIATKFGVTRQAISYTLKNSKKKIEDYLKSDSEL